MPPTTTLGELVPESGTRDSAEILDLFLGWVGEIGFSLYPAQEEALLEIMAGQHVVLNTPTGSGKSLVALGMHFKALCEGRTSYYTSPIKALASEKFFSLCDTFGPERVGMLTGDASINPAAPVRCCTAEVLSNLALRTRDLDAPYVIMDEFHYYSDPDRGVAWQIPLITLPHTRYLLMSATLGNMAPIMEPLERFTGFESVMVRSNERPVPLDFEYRETPLHETLDDLLKGGKAPVYIVNFTQRECAELAQGLTSMKICSREERQEIRCQIGDFHFDTPYGKELRRFIGFGIGVHHAGLLPKYRLLIEQFSQRGLLRVICGTDTLGVGVNIPIRTVLFTKLAKYDGHKVGLLTVRAFKQISGRAGRKGFDEQGSVVCQAPEHTIANLKLARSDNKKKKAARKKAPRKGEVSWTRETFGSLIERLPELLQSRFRIDLGMVLNLVQKDSEADDAGHDNFFSLRHLIENSHEDTGAKRKLTGQAAQLVLSLYRAGLLRMVRDKKSDYLWVTVDEELQREFAMHQPLSLYLVETLELLEQDSAEFSLDLVSLVESILEDPRAILYKQVDKLRGELVARLKAEGVPYEERMEQLTEVTHPKPNEEFAYETFHQFREQHPWVIGERISPKGIGREIFENFWSFSEFVRHYGLHRSEGVVLRYLSQLYKTLARNVPERAKTTEIYDVESFFRTLLEHTDTSLLEEWESLLHPELRSQQEQEREEARLALRRYELFHDPRAFAARLRAEIHQLVRALAGRDWELAVDHVRQEDHDAWPAERFEETLAPFFEQYGEIVFTPQARLANLTVIDEEAPRRWRVRHVLLDPNHDNFWHLAGTVDLSAGQSLEGPLLTLHDITG